MNMERDVYVDFLRALGLILLIGVHVNAPYWYVPIRSFDVPLMVFVSAMCYKPLRGGVVTYLIKRFKRIYIPVFVFLIIYFLVAILSHNLNIQEKSSIELVLGSFMLLNEPSIGFVWIMRVFLIMAIIMPVLYKIISCYKHAWIIIIIVLIMSQIAIANIDIFNNNQIGYLLGNQILLYAIGYSPIAILGLVIKKISYQQISGCVLFAMIVLIMVLSYNKMEFCPQTFKYPPSSIFQFYGIIMCSLLWMCRPTRATKEWTDFAKRWLPLISYLSKNSMWIFLWHIMALHLLWSINRIMPMPWIGRYCFVVIAAVLITYIYQKLISYLPKRLHNILK